MSRSSGGCKSETQVTKGSVPGGEGGLSSCLPMATFLPSPHVTELTGALAPLSPYKGTSPIRGARIHDLM